MIKIEVSPIGAVRMTNRGKWTSIPAQRYLAYKLIAGYQLRAQCEEPFEGPLSLFVTFHMPMPDSWSLKMKKKLLGAPVVVKPDIDNLVKGLMDAANGILYKDDNQVTDITVKKRYAEKGMIELTVQEVIA